MRTLLPGPFSGTLTAPPSKSVLQRAVACATLAEGESVLLASVLCEDALASLEAARGLGTRVSVDGEVVRIRGGGGPGGLLRCGESGTALRIFAALAALSEHPVRLEAEGTLAHRSVAMLEAPLRALGARCSTAVGRPPVEVCGRLRSGRVEVDGRASSQHVSGLLLALPLVEGESEVVVYQARSRPYLGLTVEVARLFGVEITASEALDHFHIQGGQCYRARELEIEGDWSAGAFGLVLGAMGQAVEVAGLEPSSSQPDRAVTRWLDGPIEADLTDTPDLFPPLAVLATARPGASVLRGVHRLRGKESDRAAALVELLGTLGARIEVEVDLMRVWGGPLHGGRVRSHGDHRMAMAAAVAASRADGPVILEGDEAVSKSWPGFWEAWGALQRG